MVSRRLLITTGLLVAGLVALLHLRSRPDASGAQQPVVDDSDEPGERVSPGRSASPSLPVVPRWTGPDDAPPLTDTGEIREQLQRTVQAGAVTARFHPRRARYPKGLPVLIDLELTDPDGNPIDQRANVSLMVMEGEPGGEGEIYTRGFMANPDEPGRFLGFAEPRDSEARRLRFTLTVRDPNDPTKVAASDVTVEYGAPAHLGSVSPEGELAGDGLAVAVAVKATAAGPAAVRAELRDAEGTVYGESSQTGELVAGDNRVVLRFPGVSTPEDTRLYLGDVTLFTGEDMQWADFRTEPLRIEMR